MSPLNPHARMLRNGRPEDQVFAPEEILFRRYIKDHWVENLIVPAHFSFPRPSVNRQKYSEPEDAISAADGSLDGYGVLEFEVRGIPAQLADGQGTMYRFFASHVPNEENFSHSEIWCSIGNQNQNQAVPSSSVKKKFRTMLSQHVRVRIEAAI